MQLPLDIPYSKSTEVPASPRYSVQFLGNDFDAFVQEMLQNEPDQVKWRQYNSYRRMVRHQGKFGCGSIALLRRSLLRIMGIN